MTVGKLFSTMVLIPLATSIFAYPIYLKVVEGVGIYDRTDFLHFITVLAAHLVLLVIFGFILCYTICNWEEDLKSWWSWENFKYYTNEGKSNKYKNRGY